MQKRCSKVLLFSILRPSFLITPFIFYMHIFLLIVLLLYVRSFKLDKTVTGNIPIGNTKVTLRMLSNSLKGSQKKNMRSNLVTIYKKRAHCFEHKTRLISASQKVHLPTILSHYLFLLSLECSYESVWISIDLKNVFYLLLLIVCCVFLFNGVDWNEVQNSHDTD